MGFPQVGVGLQLVRDPTTGHLLLIHSAGEYIFKILLICLYVDSKKSHVVHPGSRVEDVF